MNSSKKGLTKAMRSGDSIIRVESSRVEPSRVESSRVEPSRAESSRVEPSRAEPSRAEPSPSRAEPSRVEPSRVEPSRAEPSRAEPSRAEPSRAEPSRAEPSRAEAITAPRLREQRRPPSPPDRLPSPRGGHPSPSTASAAARRGLLSSARALAAAALLALVVGLALPATAQAQTPTCTLNTGDLWCGVVTVGTYSNGVGFTDSDGALTDNTGDQTITIGSSNYMVSSVVILVSPAGALVMGLDTEFPDSDAATLEFHIGSSTFEVSAATFTNGIGYSWLDSGLSWSVGDMVDVRLRRSTDDDAPTISVEDQTVNEGALDPGDLLEDEGFPFQLTLSAASVQPVRFKVRRVELASDTATDDALKHGILYLEQGEIAAGETSVYLRADIILDDTLDEPDETFTLEIYDFENATAGDQTRSTITIEDDDDPPSVSVADAEATEGSPAEFAVTLSAASGKTVTVGVATSIESSDTAAAGDFTAVPATTLTFMPGDTAKTVMVQTTADTLDEPDETFTLTLSSPSNVTLGDATAKGSITNNDNTALASVTIAADQPAFTAELDDVTFTLTRTEDLAAALDVAVALTQDRPLLESEHLAQTVTFAAGEATATLRILFYRFAEHTVTEESTLTATVQTGSGYEPGSPNTVSTRIVVTDPAVTAWIEETAYTFAEDATGNDATIAVILRIATGVPVPNRNLYLSVSTQAISGQAESRVDYEPFTLQLEFQPSDFTSDETGPTARQEVTLVIVDDALDESDETLSVFLEPSPSLPEVVALRQSDGTACPSLNFFSRCAVTVTIVDNDANNAPVFTEGTSTTRSVAEEYTVSDDNIGTAVTATDDDGDTLTYTLEGTDASSFDIEPNSGQIKKKSGLTYNYEANPSYAVTVSVSDGKGGEDSINVTINVTSDRAALIALYNATDGDNWKNNTNWLSNEPLSSWYGVNTTIYGRVTRLYLPENQLSGTIPEGLGVLAKLQELWLNHNMLRGEIPVELGNLTNLQQLTLSDNMLTGGIPAELGKLTDLYVLSLWGNMLSGEIPEELGNLTLLLELYLNRNELSGTIPVDLGKLASSGLWYLDLSQNMLSGEIPAELGKLTLLQVLSLSQNMLSGMIPEELGNLASLQYLYLRGNELSGEIPVELGNLTSLLELYLYDNGLTGDIPEDLGRLTSLSHLALWDNPGLAGPVPAAVGVAADRAALVAIYLANGGASWTNAWVNPYALYDPLSNWSGVTTGASGRVTHVQLGNRGLAGPVTAALEVLTDLQELSLNDNASLYGTLPVRLQELASLAKLDVRNTSVCTPAETAFQTWLDTITFQGTPCPAASFAESTYSATEGGPAATVTIRLSAAPGRELTILLTATPAGGATEDDYTVTPAIVTFRSMDTEATVEITAVADSVSEVGHEVVLGFQRPLSGITEQNPATATVPVNLRGRGREAVLDFAHFANGEGITSDLVFVNVETQPSGPAPTPFQVAIPPIRPALYFYDKEGNPIAAESVVEITGDLEVRADGGLSVRTEMEPLGELTISTHGQGELVSGSVRVVSDGPIGGVLRFDLPGIGVAGVGASQPVRDALFPARREGDLSTAAAIRNLGEEAIEVSCRLMKEGAVLEEEEIPLEANGQQSRYIGELFPRTDTSDFVGSVRCTAPPGEGMFTGVAVELDASNQIFTTLPVVPVERAAASQE